MRTKIKAVDEEVLQKNKYEYALTEDTLGSKLPYFSCGKMFENITISLLYPNKFLSSEQARF